MEKSKLKIDLSKTVLGIEFGSTRIKAVLADCNGAVLAVGCHAWENAHKDGLWTYSEDAIINGLRECYGDLKANVKDKYGLTVKRIGAIGISGMMHGYIALGDSGKLLTPFRTWRNNNAEVAAQELTKLFGFHIPARWSIAHLYQAILGREDHIHSIKHITTLAGYVHSLLTGKRVVGIGEASGMFPIDSAVKNYDKRMIKLFDGVAKDSGVSWSIADILPEVLLAGDNGGNLTDNGALIVDPDGDLESGIPLSAPEGDAGTGMVATNSVRKHTGNVSAGTSIFGMVVLDKPLNNVYDEIDIVSTPIGDDVAMVHCNNCTSDFNAWAETLGEFAEAVGAKADVHRLLCEVSLSGEPDCGGVINYNYVSGENITGISEGRPLLVRKTDSRMNLANLARSQLYSAIATLKIGMDILIGKEGTRLDSIIGHGGLFKTEGVCQRYLAAALSAPVAVMETAGEGGAWGMALLAAYMLNGSNEPLDTWLNEQVFGRLASKTISPDPTDSAGFDAYMKMYKSGLPIVRTAVKSFADKSAITPQSVRIEQLKKDVYEANLQLVKNGLVIFTWGNVSGIDRESGLVVIKPSGVDYDGMRASDMVVVDLNGNVVNGDYKPSSDTPTHLELYKAHPEIGGIVHTHSTYATAFAQAGRSLPAYGTTHADYFYGDVPCARALTEAEISNGYERNTGIVINETLNGCKDVMSVPSILIKSHGPFSWGKDAANAVYNATVLEQVARMALLTERLAPNVSRADKFLLDKHYLRKHGKNAYYGQKEKK